MMHSSINGKGGIPNRPVVWRGGGGTQRGSAS